MKTALPVFLLLLALVASAQSNFNRAMHDNNEIAAGSLLVLNKHAYFLAESKDVQSGGTRYLYKFDENGNQIFKKGGMGHVTAGIVSLDGNLVYVGQDVFCSDVIIEQNHEIFIAKIEASGNVTHFHTDSVHMFITPTAVVQLPDSSYRMYTDSAMYTYSKTLQMISKTNIGYSSIHSAIPDNGNILLVSQGVSTSTLVVTTVSGSVVNTIPLSAGLNKIVPAGNAGFIGLGYDGKLYKYNSNKVLSLTSAFSYFVSDFCLMNDSIYCITYGNTQGYAVADVNFNSLHSSTISTTNYSQHGIAGFGSKIAVVGSGKSTNISWGPMHGFSTITVKDKMAPTAFSEDIKFLSVGADSVYSSYYAQSNYATVYVRPALTIKNTGASTITNFKVNLFLNPSMSCGVYVFQDNITNISLAPGATMTVAGKKFVGKGISVPNGPGPLPVFETFCFYTTLPNGEPDKTFEDNEICQSFGFIITSLKENPSVIRELSVFPNPASESVHVKAGETLKSITVINALGSVVSIHHPDSQEAEIGLTHLSSGIYFLQIQSENGMAMKKIIRN